MRRTDREITDINEIISILQHCKVLRLAMSVQNEPYLIPLNFGYFHGETGFEFYFHCAKEGKKLDMIRSNPKVCFEMDCDHELVNATSPCEYGYRYRSVVGYGEVQIVLDEDEKALLLSRLMKHQTNEDFSFSSTQVHAVTVCKIQVTAITAKARIS